MAQGGEASAPRRVEDLREGRESERHRRESELGTSWVSVVLGWLAALGAGLFLSGIAGAVMDAILGAGGGRQSATEGGMSGLAGLLITLLLAFLS
jgi:hypothetical protein